MKGILAAMLLLTPTTTLFAECVGGSCPPAKGTLNFFEKGSEPAPLPVEAPPASAPEAFPPIQLPGLPGPSPLDGRSPAEGTYRPVTSPPPFPIGNEVGHETPGPTTSGVPALPSSCPPGGCRAGSQPTNVRVSAPRVNNEARRRVPASVPPPVIGARDAEDGGDKDTAASRNLTMSSSDEDLLSFTSSGKDRQECRAPLIAKRDSKVGFVCLALTAKDCLPKDKKAERTSEQENPFFTTEVAVRSQSRPLPVRAFPISGTGATVLGFLCGKSASRIKPYELCKNVRVGDGLRNGRGSATVTDLRESGEMGVRYGSPLAITKKKASLTIPGSPLFNDRRQVCAIEGAGGDSVYASNAPELLKFVAKFGAADSQLPSAAPRGRNRGLPAMKPAPAHR